jgi:hypothetical protein
MYFAEANRKKIKKVDKMNRKALLVLLVISLVAGVGAYAYMDTWTNCHIVMTAGTASVVTIGQYAECDAITPVTNIDWNGVEQGQVYERTVYVINEGTRAVYLTYLPTLFETDEMQTRMEIICHVIEGPATVCQLNPITWIPMLEKDPAICDAGFYLTPDKMVKVDIELTPLSLDTTNSPWTFDFYFYGCAL